MKWRHNNSCIMSYTKYSIKFMHWLVMKSIGEIEGKFNVIFPCHGFLGSSKKTFKNFSVNNSSHNDYSILLPFFTTF